MEFVAIRMFRVAVVILLVGVAANGVAAVARVGFHLMRLHYSRTWSADWAHVYIAFDV